MLFDRLTRVTDQLRGGVAELEPERLSGPDAARLVAAFAEVERSASAAKLLAARRVESSGFWRWIAPVDPPVVPRRIRRSA